LGHEGGTKTSGLGTSLAVFTLKNHRKKQASGAILITHGRQRSRVSRPFDESGLRNYEGIFGRFCELLCFAQAAPFVNKQTVFS